MNLCNVEFFDRNFNFIFNDSAQIDSIDYDYLTPEPTEIYISKTDLIKVRYIIWITGDIEFLGIVTGVEYENNQTKISFEPFISAFDRDILFVVNRQNSTNTSYALENYVATVINSWVKSIDDSEWIIPVLNTIPESTQLSWTFNWTADSFAQGRCKVNLRNDLLYHALKDYGIAVNAVPNFETMQIDLHIGTISGYNLDSANDLINRFNISADDQSVHIASFSIDSAGDVPNSLRIYSTETSSSTYKQYFLHNDGRSPAYDLLDEARITPVKTGLDYTSGTGSTFNSNAKTKAGRVFKNLTWQSAIELVVDNNDSLIKPKDLKIGQVCKIWHDGKAYDSILTAKKLGDETTLTFGSVRTTLTKQNKLSTKKK